MVGLAIGILYRVGKLVFDQVNLLIWHFIQNGARSSSETACCVFKIQFPDCISHRICPVR